MALCSGEAGVSSNPEIVFPHEPSHAVQSPTDSHNVGVPSAANPSLRKLTKAQSKRLISGITEVIAGDAVLRSIAYDTALRGVNHLVKLKDSSCRSCPTRSAVRGRATGLSGREASGAHRGVVS